MRCSVAVLSILVSAFAFAAEPQAPALLAHWTFD